MATKWLSVCASNPSSLSNILSNSLSQLLKLLLWKLDLVVIRNSTSEVADCYDKKQTDSNSKCWHDNALLSAKGGVKVGELSILTCLLKDKQDSDTIEQKSRIVQKHGGQTSMILSLSSIQSNRNSALDEFSSARSCGRPWYMSGKEQP